MNRKDRKKRERYEEEVRMSQVRSLMDSLIPASMVNVRQKLELPESQRFYSGDTPAEEENEILKIAIQILCKELESTVKVNNDNATTVKSLEKTLKLLQKKVDACSRPLATSVNSGTPSSHNPISKQEEIKKRTRSLRKKSNRHVGGQLGHKGTTLKLRSKVDNREKIYPQSSICPTCGTVIPKELFTEGERHQILDLCENVIQTIEKVSMKATCPICGTEVKGEFGEYERGHVNYGTRLKACATLLNNRHAMPFGRTAELINDLTDLHMSQGTVKNMVQRAGNLSIKEVKKIIKNLSNSKNGCPYVFADETGAGSGRWLWVFGNDKTALIVMTHSRSHEEILRIFPDSLREKYLLTDRHSAYFTKDIVVMGHQICLVHILRNIQFYIDYFPKYEWPKRFYSMIQELIHKSKEIKTDDERLKLHDEYKARLLSILAEPTIRDNLPSKYAVEEIDKFKEGLLRRKDDFLTFLLVHMPFHNNRAELCVRSTKTKMKVAGCYRTDEGGVYYANLQSIVQTCRMNGENIYKAFIKLFQKNDIIQEVT